MDAKRKAYLYIRVSTERQATEGLSLEAQREKMNAWCVYHDVEIGGIFEDAGYSGKRADNRPGLVSVLDEACKNKGILLTYSISRLARNTRQAIEISERLRKAGAHFVSITEALDTTTSSGVLLFEIMSVLASFESRQIAERVQSVRGYKRNRQEFLGGNIPYGYMVVSAGVPCGVDGLTDTLGRPVPCAARAEGDPVRELVENPDEQRVIAAVKAARAEGLSLRKIAARLESQGILPRVGETWNPKLLMSMARAA